MLVIFLVLTSFVSKYSEAHLFSDGLILQDVIERHQEPGVDHDWHRFATSFSEMGLTCNDFFFNFQRRLRPEFMFQFYLYKAYSASWKNFHFCTQVATNNVLNNLRKKNNELNNLRKKRGPDQSPGQPLTG